MSLKLIIKNIFIRGKKDIHEIYYKNKAEILVNNFTKSHAYERTRSIIKFDMKND
jgi:hypothetical protein